MVFSRPKAIQISVANPELLQSLSNIFTEQNLRKHHSTLSIRSDRFVFSEAQTGNPCLEQTAEGDVELVFSVGGDSYRWRLFRFLKETAIDSEQKQRANFLKNILLTALLCCQILLILSEKINARSLGPEESCTQDVEEKLIIMVKGFWEQIASNDSLPLAFMRLYRMGMLVLHDLLTNGYLVAKDVRAWFDQFPRFYSGTVEGIAEFQTLLLNNQQEIRSIYANSPSGMALKAVVAAGVFLLLMTLAISCFYGAGIAAGLWVGVQSFFTAVSAANGLAIATVVCPIALGIASAGATNRFFTPKPSLDSEIDALSAQLGCVA